MLPILDPKTHTVTIFNAPVRDANTPEGLGPGHAAMASPLEPSAYWGNEKIWDSKVNNHNSMIDGQRPPLAGGGRARAGESRLLQAGLGSSLGQTVSAQADPSRTGDARSQDDEIHLRRHLLPDPSLELRLRRQRDLVDEAAAGGGGVVGGSIPRCSTRPATRRKSQGWTALVLDTNGNGKRDDYVEPNQPVDPAKDKRIAQVFYAVMASPADNSIWGTLRASPARSLRLDPGSNPPETALAEIYNVRCRASARAAATSTARGSSGCRSQAAISAPSTGASARCSMARPPPATIARKAGVSTSIPGPGFAGIGENSAESSYYSWVDQHNTFGLGADVRSRPAT